MTEIKIKIDDQYVAAFLNFLETLSYVKVEKTTGNGTKQSAREKFLESASPDHPLWKAVQAEPQNVTLEMIISASGHKKTDWAKVAAHAENMDVQESTEVLLAQLNA